VDVQVKVLDCVK